MICRHFNLSYQDVEEWLPWDEFYILMAVALDLDELDNYSRFLLAGGKAKDFKWSSPDRAGTLEYARPGATAQERVRGIFEAAARGISRGRFGVDNLPKGGKATDFFRLMNRPKIQRIEYPDGKVEYRDMEGNLVEMPSDAAFAIVEDEED